jgi:hypothetical protein
MERGNGRGWESLQVEIYTLSWTGVPKPLKSGSDYVRHTVSRTYDELQDPSLSVAHDLPESRRPPAPTGVGTTHFEFRTLGIHKGGCGAIPSVLDERPRGKYGR